MDKRKFHTIKNEQNGEPTLYYQNRKIMRFEADFWKGQFLNNKFNKKSVLALLNFHDYLGELQ